MLRVMARVDGLGCDVEQGGDLLEDECLADNDQDDEVDGTHEDKACRTTECEQLLKRYLRDSADSPQKPAIMTSVQTVRVMMAFHFLVGS